MKKLLLLLFVFASLGVAQKRLYSSKYPIEKPIVANAWDSTTSKNPLEFLIYNDTTKLWLDRDIDNPNQYRMRLSLRKTNLTSLSSYVGLQSFNSRADSGISLVGANANGEVFGSGRRVNAAGYPTGGLNRFFKFLNDSIIFYINASEAFKISSASAVTITGTLGVTGAITGSGIIYGNAGEIRSVHATAPNFRLLKTNATAVTYDVGIISDNFAISESGVGTPFTIAKTTGNAQFTGTLGVTSGGVGLTISKTSGPSIELIKTAATAQTWQIAGDANFNIYDITDAATVAFSIALGTQAVTIPGTLAVTGATTVGTTSSSAVITENYGGLTAPAPGAIAVVTSGLILLDDDSASTTTYNAPDFQLKHYSWNSTKGAHEENSWHFQNWGFSTPGAAGGVLTAIMKQGAPTSTVQTYASFAIDEIGRTIIGYTKNNASNYYGFWGEDFGQWGTIFGHTLPVVVGWPENSVANDLYTTRHILPYVSGTGDVGAYNREFDSSFVQDAVISSHIMAATVYSNATSARAMFIDADGDMGTVASSLRYKKDVKPIEINPLAVLSLRPVSFTYKKGNGGREIGFIAEEVNKVIPQIVGFNDSGLPEYVQYDRLPTLLVGLAQIQEKRISSLEKTIKALEARLTKLEGGVK